MGMSCQWVRSCIVGYDKVLETEGGKVATQCDGLRATNCIFKYGQMVTFMLCIFYNNKFLGFAFQDRVSLVSAGCPRTQRSIRLYLSGAGIKGMYHRHPATVIYS